ncbi:MAG: hypothetical protein LBR83_02120 [Clostridiales bacterium]|jgi:hypothetical protein|nr:hypothetical protein [Clostridiales bacterium]
MQNLRDKLINGEPFSPEKFASPSREFGILPFWFVNGEMDYGEMEYQIKEFADKGMPGFIFHSRFGIKDYMPYLGEEWLKRYEFAAQKARELGMQVWIYDEYNWPSGTCNQEIMAENPALTGRYLQMVVNKIPGQYFMFMEGTDSRYNDLEQSEPVFACAILDEDIKNGNNKILNLMPNLCFDKVISWEAPEGPWHLCYFIERKTSWYSDVLNEETTAAFINKTHQKYKNHLPGDIADNVAGFYTDEPAMHYFTAGADNQIIPWSAKMFKIFKEWNGYDLKERLPQLFFDIGEDFNQVRHDFWSALSKQYERSYYQQIRKWCDDNGVVFTGHLLHEEYLRSQAKSGGNLFHMLKNLKMTGVDHLYPRIGTREMPEEHVALKIASSAAHQNGSTRLICESLGGSYWDCTMERMKWIADWEYVLGVNILNPHGFHYSIEGERKRDWPPSQFYHHTWWRFYGLFNDYLKRLGYLMTGGRHVAKAAVLFPINSIWANFVPMGADPCHKLCQDDFEYITDALLRLHYDFDYVDEDMMGKMTVGDGKISVNGEEYRLVILPPMTHIKENTLALLKKFIESGGKLIADTLLPCGLLEPKGEIDLKTAEEIFGADGKELKDHYLADGKGFSITGKKHPNGGEALVIHGPGLRKGGGIETLRQAVASLIDWDVSMDSDELFYLYRVKDGVPFYFIINPTGSPVSAKVSVRRQGSPKYYNLLDGSVTDVAVYTRENGCVTIPWEFPAVGSAVFSFEEGTESPHVSEADFSVTEATGTFVKGHTKSVTASAVYVNGGKTVKVTQDFIKEADMIPLNQEWDFEPGIDNTLVIKHWKFAIADDHNQHFFQEDFDTSGWLPYTVGGWELQLPYERENPEEYPVDVLYKARFTAAFIPGDIKMLIDGFKGTSYNLYINGVRVDDKGERSFIDAEMKQILIGKYLLIGQNDIAIRLTVEKKVQGLLDYIKISGSHAVEERGGEYAVVKPSGKIKTGSWTGQGYPFFSGTGKYTQTVSLSKENTDGRLFLHADCGKDVLEVEVNGKKAGVCLWQPYVLDITGLVKEGGNEITLNVTNTLNNLLEGVEQPSGVFRAEIVRENSVCLKI